MKIIFWGTPEYATKSLQNLILSEHQILAVITQPDRKRSRGNKLLPSPIKKLSMENNIPVLCPDNLNKNNIFIANLKKLNCDLFVVVAYGRILSKEILDIPKYGSWNSHASLLPRWRGAAPIQWSLLSGDKFTGIGIMKMEEGLDTGDILIEESIKINENDNLDSLTNKLSLLSADLLLKAIEIISKTKRKDLKTIPQNTLGRELIYARLIYKSDYQINFNEKAIQIIRRVNGLFPRAFIKYKNQNVKILKMRLIEKNEFPKLRSKDFDNNFKPGHIIGTIKNEGFVVATLTEMLLIQEGKLAGKNISKGNQLIQQLKPVIGEIINY